MKWIVAPIFFLLMISQVFSKWIVIAEFNIYRTYIVKNLCENRYRPKLHCDGHCILMKKMAEEENQSTPAGTIKFNSETLTFVDTHTEYPEKKFTTTSISFVTSPYLICRDPYIPAVFHPPLA